ncbi:hypothetical protein SAMN04488557_3257 [Hyphomicrobium facile]|uniref:Uncharacterized protein n=1 Tax=Hyphomicrobium facile TaxID=51670 RepID=A0A1I7NSH2_9HYPH|nr:hypothetical protein SAMN04488557_3257 [Hyphomicrobium facile]
MFNDIHIIGPVFALRIPALKASGDRRQTPDA